MINVRPSIFILLHTDKEMIPRCGKMSKRPSCLSWSVFGIGFIASRHTSFGNGHGPDPYDTSAPTSANHCPVVELQAHRSSFQRLFFPCCQALGVGSLLIRELKQLVLLSPTRVLIIRRGYGLQNDIFLMPHHILSILQPASIVLPLSCHLT